MATLLIPGGLPGLSHVIVAGAGENLDGAAWPVMDLLDRLPRVLDLTASLAAMGLTIAGEVQVSASASLSVALLSWTSAGVISLRVAPVSLANDVPAVEIEIPLSNEMRLNLVVLQPVENRTPAGLVPIGSSAHTADNSNLRADSALLTADAA